MSFPSKVWRPMWLGHDTGIGDADLYVSTLDAAGSKQESLMHLRQAVQAFKAGLDVPTVAMLDAASEGAWTEAGRALAAKPPVDAFATALESTLADPRASMRSKAAKSRSDSVTGRPNQPVERSAGAEAVRAFT